MSTIYATRRETLMRELHEQNIDLAFITDPANVFYYSGFFSDPHERFLSLVLDRRQNAVVLFTPALDKSAAASASDVTKIVPISDEQLPFDVVAETLDANATTIAVEKKAFNLFRFDELRGAFPNAQVVDIQPFTNTLRMNKSTDEIEFLQQATDIIEKVLEEGVKSVKVGMTELELTAHLETLMRTYGADGPSFTTIVLSGEKAALPHGTPGNRQIQQGDFLLIDMGVKKDGYCSDTTRTFIIGEPTEEQQKIYDIVRASNEAGIQAVKAGVPLKEFDISARQVIEDAGYGEYFNNRVGHGLGIDVHEEPSIHQNNEALATKGLVFTIEPGIYIPNWGGVRIEDTVYINEQGEAQVLTSFTKELISL